MVLDGGLPHLLAYLVQTLATVENPTIIHRKMDDPIMAWDKHF